MDVDFLVKNKEFFMKNTIKMFGIIALIAVAAFTMTTCKNDDPAEEDTGHTHEWGAWKVTTAPDYTTEGKETRTCALDSSHTETRTIPKKAFTSAAELNTWLSAQPVNTVASPYTIALNVSNLEPIRYFV
jgi:hypothetical protein